MIHLRQLLSLLLSMSGQREAMNDLPEMPPKRCADHAQFFTFFS
ncbi:hypothetical protein NBRC111894_2297 [Sporolactobacillus inulinus]|uniref:Uncharacterized protein n=1 Tax=Sporolactobacillus inulinus TaxID=2078 RepID=A0A4Y1ZCQ8_9BACL|nr:hypothetical protein NBRC111894_2297 [Sporolactobacillus inulinus]